MKKTSGNLKIVNQFQKFSESSYYRELISLARRRLNLPEEGIEYSGIEDLKKYGRPSRYPITKERLEDYIGYQTMLIAKEALIEFPIKNYFLEEVIRYHIIYNQFFFDEIREYGDADIGRIDHLEDEYGYFGIDEYDFNSTSEHNDGVLSLIEDYPISIRISADCSQTDIINYIKANKEYIKELQGQYKNKESRYKIETSKTSFNKLVKKRDEFIYKHRDLANEEIMRRLWKKFNDKYGIYDIDAVYVDTIIKRMEKKKS